MINNNIVIENARIGFRNFSGKEGKFNKEGDRNFCVFLDLDVAIRLANDGWNIKWLDPKDEGDDKQAILSITVSYNNIPPKIIIISSKGKTILDASSVSILDWAEIKEVDLIARPYNWEVNGKYGVKAYVKSMYITIAEDEFESKYYDVPDSAADTIGGCGNCETCSGEGHCKHGD